LNRRLLKIEQVDLTTPSKATTSEPKVNVVENRKPLVNSKAEVKQVATKTIKKSLESKVNTTANTGKCHHDWFKLWFAQQLIQYACDVSNSDIDFILTLNAEMGSWNWQGQSNVIQKDWKREPSFWMCQIHYKYHKKTIYENLPFNRIKESRYLTDWKYQIETCYKMYKWGTKMYGYNVRHKVLKGLIYINNKYY